MTINPDLMRRMRLVFHSAGFGCLAGAILLQVLVSMDIVTHGYSRAVEANLGILVVDLVISTFALGYFLCIYRRRISQVK